MVEHTVKFMPSGVTVTVSDKTTLLDAERLAGFVPDAPCGGGGTCGKCAVNVIEGTQTGVLRACRVRVTGDMTVGFEQAQAGHRILSDGVADGFEFEPSTGLSIAYDIGTTTIAAYLLDAATGETLAVASCLNPQTQFGGDVISRAEYALEHGVDALRDVVRATLRDLMDTAVSRAAACRQNIRLAVIVGNTCMHHMLMGLSPQSLVLAPYNPVMTEALDLPAAGFFDIHPDARVRILPVIAGFVGADTVGVMLAAKFDTLDELTLAIDIGTNGELVLGNRRRALACSTAAGPAFEGAKISCGMRGAEGAIDHVSVKDGKLSVTVIGGGEPKGICGSGLVDLIACMLKTGAIDESGRLTDGSQNYWVTGDIYITQKDIREMQLAKAALAAGIQLMAKQLGVKVSDIKKVLIAGAFGNYAGPAGLCAIGLIPQALSNRIELIGNAAGEGARRAALSEHEWRKSSKIAKFAEFLELATDPEFQDVFIDELAFPEGDE